MPIYSYKCNKCRNALLTAAKVHGQAFDALPGVQGAGQATHSTAGIVFKGSGWYITNSKKVFVGDRASGKDKDSAESKPAETEKKALDGYRTNSTNRPSISKRQERQAPLSLFNGPTSEFKRLGGPSSQLKVARRADDFLMETVTYSPSFVMSSRHSSSRGCFESVGRSSATQPCQHLGTIAVKCVPYLGGLQPQADQTRRKLFDSELEIFLLHVRCECPKLISTFIIGFMLQDLIDSLGGGCQV